MNNATYPYYQKNVKTNKTIIPSPSTYRACHNIIMLAPTKYLENENMSYAHDDEISVHYGI